MKDIFIVTKFTMKDMIKRKSFIISTLIILALIVIGFNIPNIIKMFNGNNINFNISARQKGGLRPPFAYFHIVKKCSKNLSAIL